MWLPVILAFTTLVYAAGLHGPFLFDDTPNLRPLADWLDGRTGWQEALFGNRSGMFGRPLSMLSFVANALLFGMSPFWFKLGNLVIHLVCGSLIYSLMQRLLQRDVRLQPHATAVALAISAIWLLHPMQVSTVLYVVQRMAQLSTLFMLLALLAFIQGRLALEGQQLRKGLAWLFIAMPAATLAAMLCKENGALAPLLCLVLELGYFRPATGVSRPRPVWIFFVLTLALPALAASAWFVAFPETILAGYEGRSFTLGERLLSQPRALFGYISALLLPRGPALGLYSDDFAISTSILQPISTLIALFGLGALIAIAAAFRKRAPVVFTGIAFFLCGHAMESSLIPLEMYFEHRNYLPSAGIFLALVGGTTLLTTSLSNVATRPVRRLLRAGVLGLLVMLGIATAARSWVWQSWTTIVQQGALEHPRSVRAQLDYAGIVWRQGKIAEASAIFALLSRSEDPIARHMGYIYAVKLQCQEFGSVDSVTLARLNTLVGERIQLAEMQGFEVLAGLLGEHGRQCDGLSIGKLADLFKAIADAAPQPATQTPVWRTRFQAADLYRRDSQIHEAANQAALAWMSGKADAAVGVLLANLYFLDHDLASAQLVLDDVRSKMRPWDTRNRKLVLELQSILEDKRTGASRDTYPASINSNQ